MSDITQDEMISKVSSIFDVKDVIINTDDIQFKIEDIDFKNKFVNLARELEVRNFVPRLEKSFDGVDIFVTRLPKIKRKWLSKSWVPRILFAVTVTMVLIDGYFRTDFVNSLAFIGDPFQMSILYAFSLNFR